MGRSALDCYVLLVGPVCGFGRMILADDCVRILNQWEAGIVICIMIDLALCYHSSQWSVLSGVVVADAQHCADPSLIVMCC